MEFSHFHRYFQKVSLILAFMFSTTANAAWIKASEVYPDGIVVNGNV